MKYMKELWREFTLQDLSPVDRVISYYFCISFILFASFADGPIWAFLVLACNLIISVILLNHIDIPKDDDHDD